MGWQQQMISYTRDHFVHAPSQWETVLHCNIISPWLGKYTKWFLVIMLVFKADSRFVPSQWEMVLLCNNVSHWLGASLESALVLFGTAQSLDAFERLSLYVTVSNTGFHNTDSGPVITWSITSLYSSLVHLELEFNFWTPKDSKMHASYQGFTWHTKFEKIRCMNWPNYIKNISWTFSLCFDIYRVPTRSLFPGKVLTFDNGSLGPGKVLSFSSFPERSWKSPYFLLKHRLMNRYLMSDIL